MSFGSNAWLFGLIILFIMLFVFILHRWLRIRFINRMMNPALFERINRHIDFRYQDNASLIFLSAVLFITLALARPRYNKNTEIIRTRGSEIMVMVDVSMSMLCEDIKPNRLERTKIAIENFLDLLEDDAVGLGEFAGEGHIIAPPTTDYDALNYFINAIDVSPVMKPGTNIEDAIRTAMTGFSNNNAGKGIILITDGEQTVGDYKAALKEAKERGIKIYTIGIGSPKGEPIPIRDDKGNIIDYKKDSKGKIVLSRLDEKVLKDIAAETGGVYYNASSGDEFNQIITSLSKMKKSFNKEKIRINYGELFQIPLLIAFLLLIAEMLLPLRRKTE